MKKTNKKENANTEKLSITQLSITLEELRKKIERRKRQIAFDKYPKNYQDYLTARGLNPYITDPDEQIEYKVTYIVKKEK